MTQTAPQMTFSPSPVFCAALELSVDKWKLAFRFGEPRRLATIKAGDWSAFDAEVLKSRVRFGLADDAKLFTCYEAGRDGNWIHRELEKKGIKNVIIDAASIEVSRRARRAKTDTIDAVSLAEKLQKYLRGDEDVWRVVHVPSVEHEDARRLHRERERLVHERTGHVTRIKSLLALIGQKLGNVRHLTKVMSKLPERLGAEAERELVRLKLVDEQIEELAK